MTLPERLNETIIEYKELNESSNEKPWYSSNANGTKTLIHKVLADEILNELPIVRHPKAHSDLYFFNKRKGIYEQDVSCRQIRKIIRSKDDVLKRNQIKEVEEYIKDTSPIVSEVNTNFIAVGNGLMNLKTFELEPYRPNVFLTQKIDTNYNSFAFDDFVHKTLQKVTKNHYPSIRNICEMFACIIYPKILVPKMFYLYGRTACNGKSSVLNMIYATFNPNGGNISSVTPQKLASNNFAASAVFGKMANIIDDLPDILIEDSGMLKTIITGGFCEIERKGKDSENVQMNTVCITASNYFPNFKESGHQINRRLHIIPFDHNFSHDPECMPDSETMERINSQSAKEYVLKLAFDSLKEMLNNPNAEKLTYNEKSIEAGETFAEQNDPLTDYFDEYDANYFEENSGRRVNDDYEKWCEANRVYPLGQKRFKEAVCSRYNMEWKTKKIKEDGFIWKSVKGFKLKK